MPMVEGTFSGVKLTPELSARLEADITKALQETVSIAFPVELGFTKGTPEFETAHRIAHNIMPGWTWVNLSEGNWAIQGKRVGDNVVTGRINILVLANAVFTNFRREAAKAVTETVIKTLKETTGKQVNLSVSIYEGEVDLTLPRELFGDLIHHASTKLLTPNGVQQFIMAEVVKELGAKAA
jgi:hypothetical protein